MRFGVVGKAGDLEGLAGQVPAPYSPDDCSSHPLESAKVIVQWYMTFPRVYPDSMPAYCQRLLMLP